MEASKQLWVDIQVLDVRPGLLKVHLPHCAHADAYGACEAHEGRGEVESPRGSDAKKFHVGTAARRSGAGAAAARGGGRALPRGAALFDRQRLGALSTRSQAQIEAASCCRRRSSAQMSASGAGETIGATLTHCPSAWHVRSAALRAAIADTSSALTAVSRAEG
jgi:hypothetical protein